MISFASDYTTGAHPEVLNYLTETNDEPVSGYGKDRFCESAKEKIKSACACPDADVYFLTGGTQTNQLIISTMLDDNEGVIAAGSGHINTHEAGAIEYTGHKVLALPENEGKINFDELNNYLSVFFGDENNEHMVFPGIVYISYPTEYGTIYSKKELSEIYIICKKYGLPLFIDGARLGYGLYCKESDLSMQDIATLCDVFYIGGTKTGALCGEAVVFTHNNAPKHFITKIKQHGALLAKGRLLGVQFEALFTDNLYERISLHTLNMAEKIKELFTEKGYDFYINSPTNQQFIILHNDKVNELRKSVDFTVWSQYDTNHTVVRFATAWSTTEADIDYLATLLG